MKITKLLIMAIILFSINKVQAQNTASQISDEQAHEIVFKGTPDDVRKLVQSGYNVNKVYLCNTLLNVAVRSSARGTNARKHPTYALEKIKILVNAGADVNLIPCPNLSMPPLHWAVSLPQELKYLEVDANKIIDEKIKNKIGECNFPGIVSKPCEEVTPEETKKIKIAVKDAMQLAYNTFSPYFMEIIDFLATNGADINLKAGTLETAPLHIAATNPQEITLAPLQYLIKKGANLNIQDKDGNTPLFWAYGLRNDSAVDVLIKSGADATITNRQGAIYKDVEGKNIRGFMDVQGNMIFNEF